MKPSKQLEIIEAENQGKQILQYGIGVLSSLGYWHKKNMAFDFDRWKYKVKGD